MNIIRVKVNTTKYMVGLTTDCYDFETPEDQEIFFDAIGDSIFLNLIQINGKAVFAAFGAWRMLEALGWVITGVDELGFTVFSYPISDTDRLEVLFATYNMQEWEGGDQVKTSFQKFVAEVLRIRLAVGEEIYAELVTKYAHKFMA